MVFVLTASLAAWVIAACPQSRAFEPLARDTAAPADRPFVPSAAIAGVLFQGGHIDYRFADARHSGWAGVPGAAVRPGPEKTLPNPPGSRCDLVLQEIRLLAPAARKQRKSGRK